MLKLMLTDKPCHLVAKKIVSAPQEINAKSVTLMVKAENLKEIKTTPEIQTTAEVKAVKGKDVWKNGRMPEVELTPEERRDIEVSPNMTRITSTSVCTV